MYIPFRKTFSLFVALISAPSAYPSSGSKLVRGVRVLQLGAAKHDPSRRTVRLKSRYCTSQVAVLYVSSRGTVCLTTTKISSYWVGY
jgi:hypothetical protein